MESVPVPYPYQSTGTGTGWKTGEFQIFACDLTEYGMNLIVSSTDKVRRESALKFWCGDGIRRFFKVQVRVGKDCAPVPALRSMVCSV